MSNQYTVGQMNQLGDALERAEFTVDDITKLRTYSQLREVRELVRGHREFVISTHLIDCAADPFIPNNWTVEEHYKGEMLEWNPDSTTLYLFEEQKQKWSNGHTLREELKGKPVANACVLDYLLAHPELIPETWKGKAIFFWGTIYRDSDGRLSVRYLCWGGGGWLWDCSWLGLNWDAADPALLLASVPALQP